MSHQQQDEKVWAVLFTSVFVAALSVVFTLYALIMLGFRMGWLQLFPPGNGAWQIFSFAVAGFVFGIIFYFVFRWGKKNFLIAARRNSE